MAISPDGAKIEIARYKLDLTDLYFYKPPDGSRLAVDGQGEVIYSPL